MRIRAPLPATAVQRGLPVLKWEGQEHQSQHFSRQRAPLSWGIRCAFLLHDGHVLIVANSLRARQCGDDHSPCSLLRTSTAGSPRPVCSCHVSGGTRGLPHDPDYCWTKGRAAEACCSRVSLSVWQTVGAAACNQATSGPAAAHLPACMHALAIHPPPCLPSCPPSPCLAPCLPSPMQASTCWPASSP